MLVKLNCALGNVLSVVVNSDWSSLNFDALALVCDATKIESCQSLARLSKRIAHTSNKTKTQSKAQKSLKALKNQSKPPKQANSHRSRTPSPASNAVQWAFVRTRPKEHGKRSVSQSTLSSTTLVQESPRSASIGSLSPRLMPSPASPLTSSPFNQTSTPKKQLKRTQHHERRQTNLSGARDQNNGIYCAKMSDNHAKTTPSPDTSLSTSTAFCNNINERIHDTSAAPGNIELPRGVAVPQGRKKPESIYSFASDSTKIGEIPLHRVPGIRNTSLLGQGDEGGQTVSTGSHNAVGLGLQSMGKPRRGLISNIFRRGASSG